MILSALIIVLASFFVLIIFSDSFFVLLEAKLKQRDKTRVCLHPQFQSWMRSGRQGGRVCLVNKPYLISFDLGSSADQCGLSLYMWAD